MPSAYYRKQNGINVYGPYTFGSTPVFGTTSYVKLGQIQINGVDNYFSGMDLFIIEARAIKSDNSGTFSTDIRIGPNASSTDTRIGTLLINNTGANRLNFMGRTVKIEGTQSVAYQTTSSNVSTDFGAASVGGRTLLNLDFTNASNNYYVSVWGQCSVNTNTMSCSYISIKHLPGMTQS